MSINPAKPPPMMSALRGGVCLLALVAAWHPFATSANGACESFHKVVLPPLRRVVRPPAYLFRLERRTQQPSAMRATLEVSGMPVMAKYPSEMLIGELSSFVAIERRLPAFTPSR